MKKLQNVTALVLVLALLCAPLSGFAFSDVSDAGTMTAVSTLQSMGVIDGFPDGTFRPGTTLTRAQFCKMAVILLGVTDVSSYQNTTVFPDVRSGHWALGYVNAAVSNTLQVGGDDAAKVEVKLISGFPDGTFRPDESITFAQAVTILMRMLGYTDKDVGLNWPQSYLSRAAAVGLSAGVNLSGNETVSRGNGARLFYNMLFCHTYANGKTGQEYIYSMGATEKKDSILLLSDAPAEDGSARSGALFSTGFALTRTPMSGALQGYKGRLIVDEDGYVLSFTPAQQTAKTISVETAGALVLKGQDGESITVPPSAVVYAGKEQTTYASVYLDLKPGQIVRVFFTGAGAVDYLLIEGASASSIAIVTDTKGNPVSIWFGGAAADAAIYKNGARATLADLCLYDTMVYSAVTNSVQACNNRIAGVYEDCTPSPQAPTEMVVAGHTLPVTERAALAMPDVKLGDRITVLLTYDGQVAAVMNDSAVSAPLALVTAQTAEKVELVTPGGLVLTGKPNFASLRADGQLVKVASSVIGLVGLNPVTYYAPDSDADLTAMKLGNTSIAAHCAFYDRASDGSYLAQVKRSDLLLNVIPRSKIVHAGYDSNGRVDILVFEGLTGEPYRYGFLKTETVVRSGGGGLTYEVTESTLSAANGETYTFVNNHSLDNYRYDMVYGVSGKSGVDGPSVDKVVLCRTHKGLTRSSFDGDTHMTIDGESYPIADGVKVFIRNTKTFKTVREARAYSDQFEAYTDKPLSEGGKIRYIIAG